MTEISYLGKKITPEQLQQSENFLLDSVHIKTYELNEPFSEIQQRILNIVKIIDKNELESIAQASVNTEKKLGIVLLPKPFGKGLKAITRIKKGEAIPYAGEVIGPDSLIKNDGSYSLEVLDYLVGKKRKYILIDGKNSGTIARFCPHFPKKDKEHVEDGIVTANTIIENYIAVDSANPKKIYMLAVFRFLEDVEPSHLIGTDYGPDFFEQLKMEPVYLCKDGNIFSTNVKKEISQIQTRSASKQLALESLNKKRIHLGDEDKDNKGYKKNHSSTKNVNLLDNNMSSMITRSKGPLSFFSTKGLSNNRITRSQSEKAAKQEKAYMR